MTGATETRPDRRDAEIEGLAAELLARYEEITLLYRLGGELAGTLDVGELCDRAMRSAIEVDGLHARGGRRARARPRHDQGVVSASSPSRSERSSCRERA